MRLLHSTFMTDLMRFVNNSLVSVQNWLIYTTEPQQRKTDPCWSKPEDSKQWRGQPKNLGAPKMFDFRRMTLFCFEKRLSKHKMTILSENLGGMDLLSPWLRLCLQITARGPNAAREAILSNDEKNYHNFVDLVEYNIPKHHIT